MRVTAATLSGGSRNQDAHVVLANAVVVLDGASSFVPTGGNRDGGWYAAHLLGELAQRVSDSAAPLRQCLHGAITAIRDNHGAFLGGPSSTVLIARWTDTEIELLALGDSTIVIQHADGTSDSMTDTRLSEVAPEIRRRYRSRLAQGCGMDDEHRNILAELQAAQRDWRNKERGYWIAEADPRAADFATVQSVSISAVFRVLLATDGAATAVNNYLDPENWADYLAAVSSSPARTLAHTHHLERTDPEGQKWPRAKRHDDKTLALLELEEPRPREQSVISAKQADLSGQIVGLPKL